MITSLYDYCCCSVTQLCLILYNPIEWSTMPGFPVLHQLPESAQTYVHWDGDCSHEVKRCFLLVRKVMTNLDSILKSRDFTLPTKVHIVKAMPFSVVMYGCESWTIKKAECWRIDAFKLWSWRRLLRFSWTATSQSERKSVLNIRWKDWCWNSNTLAIWWEELTHLKRPWCWERLKAGGEGDDRGWDGWMTSPTQWAWVWVNSGSCWWTGRVGVLQSMGSQRVRHDWVTELNWTDW